MKASTYAWREWSGKQSSKLPQNHIPTVAQITDTAITGTSATKTGHRSIRKCLDTPTLMAYLFKLKMLFFRMKVPQLVLFVVFPEVSMCFNLWEAYKECIERFSI